MWEDTERVAQRWRELRALRRRVFALAKDSRPGDDRNAMLAVAKRITREMRVLHRPARQLTLRLTTRSERHG